MKNLFLTFIVLNLLTTFGCSSCKKESVIDNGLPPNTQSGANTLGFTLNEQSWTPQGNNGTANLSLYYDATFSGGVFNLAAYRIINSSTGSRQRLTMYGDSIQFAQKIVLPNRNKFSAIFRNDISGCDYDFSDSSVKIISGYFDIQKLDKANGIFAGEFELNFKKIGCEDVSISKGRFDMRF